MKKNAETFLVMACVIRFWPGEWKMIYSQGFGEEGDFSL